MNDVYRFGPFTLDPNRRVLSRDGSPIVVTPKAFDLLVYLAQHPNRVVSKQDLMKAVWPDTIVEEGNLTQQLSHLRKTLAEQGGEQLIVTVARQGYQFTGNVVTVPNDTVTPEPKRSLPRWRPVAGWSALPIALVGAIVLGWLRFHRLPAVPDTVRLAVLPFVNLTGDSTRNYLADGLTEETITQLARLRPEQLRVIARTSVMGYKHGDARIDEIGRSLSVGYVLESSLRQSAERLRVTVQLIRVDDQSHVWASNFDYAQQDILHIEDSLAGAVTREVQLRLTPVQRARLARAPSTNALAVDAVLRGRSAFNSDRGQEAWRDAKRYFDAAIAADSNYALAWVWLGAVYRFGADREWIPVDSGYRAARQALSRALTLDPSLPEAWEGLGQMQRLVDWDWAAASTSYQRALALDPGNVNLIQRMALMKKTMGDFGGALALDQRAIELDPLDFNTKIDISGLYLMTGRRDDAIRTFDAIPADRRNSRPDFRIYLDLVTGRLADADSALPQIGDPEWQLLFRAMIAVRTGPRRTADSLLTAFIHQYHTHDAFQIAEVYGWRGDADSTFLWLDRAYAQHDQGLIEVESQLFLESVRHDPQYAAFLKKMRLPI